MAEANIEPCVLPISRIRTIMKSSPEISSISQESLFLIGKATELFVKHLATETYNKGRNKIFLDYAALAKVVNDTEQLQFLIDIIPKKIKVREYKAIMANQKKKSTEDELEDDEEEEDDPNCSR